MASRTEEPEEKARRPARMVAAVAVLVLGLGGFAVCATGVALRALPRRFTVAQQQSIMGWEVAARWRRLSAGDIFHSSIAYQPTRLLTDGGTSTISLAAQRLGIAPQSSCAGALDSSAAAALDTRGCEEVLRATYADSTDSYVVTVGVAVLPSDNSAHTAAAALDGRSAPAEEVRAVAFRGTASGQFTNSRRQLEASFSAGPYVVLYAVGYSGDRPALPVSGDQYVTAEMTSLASGVAHSVANTLASAPPTPHCPEAPGC